MNFSEYSLGWEYISAIFSYFRDLVSSKERTSHIAPKYIYRGIAKRYFTESYRLKDILELYEQHKPLIFNGSDITKNIAGSCARTYSLFDKEAALRPYNNKLRPYNGLTIKEREEQRKSEILYNELYNNFKNKVDSKLKHHINFNECSKNVETNISILKTIHNFWENKLTQPEQIRSGASVRLRDIDKKYLTVSDYLRYINNLIYDFKKINPEFGDYSEIEILAEIQHRGGASCLVDFSNNFLISLWFATNNEFDDHGYLFCYNVNADALLEDNITILNKDKWEYPIEDLLKFTRKTAQYAGGDKFRFWYWKPANINGRIARQDSVFVFGLEKFVASDHNVDVITIPAQWKPAILDTLKTYFGITSETVFPDVDGYAGSNSKTSKIDSISRYLNLNSRKSWTSQNHEEILQRGMSCLLNGQYKIALNYFLYVYPQIGYRLNDNKKKFNMNLIRLEVLYSIGLCYKKLREFNNSEFFLNKAFSACYELRVGHKLNSRCEVQESDNNCEYIPENKKEESMNALSSKFLKITDDYLDVLNNLQRYTIAKRAINILLSDQTITKTRYMLECTIQQLSILEGLKKSSNISEIHIEPFNLIIQEKTNVFYGLNLYNNLIRSIVCNPEHVIEQGKIESDTFHIYQDFNNFVKEFISTPAYKGNVNIVWSFDMFQNSINNYFIEGKYTYLRELIEDVTSQIRTVFDFMLSCKRV